MKDKRIGTARIFLLILLFAGLAVCITGLLKYFDSRGFHDEPAASANTVSEKLAGTTFNIDGFLLKDEDWWSSEEAIVIAEELIIHQKEDGGWGKDLYTEETEYWANSTIDNNATWGEIRYLAKCYTATGNETYKEACRRGIDFLCDLQYENGGWPQIVDAEGTYHAYVTFNDKAMIGVMEVMKYAKDRAETEGFAWVDDTYAKKAEEAFDKGLACILNTQVRIGNKLTGWAQQYDENTLQPAWGRAFEPPSLSAWETTDVVLFLQSLGDDPEIQGRIGAALNWLYNARITGYRIEETEDDRYLVEGEPDDLLWARFYDIETNTPVFGDRDGQIYEEMKDISQERRTGYRWYGTWPLQLFSPHDDSTDNAEQYRGMTPEEFSELSAEEQYQALLANGLVLTPQHVIYPEYAPMFVSETVRYILENGVPENCLYGDWEICEMQKNVAQVLRKMGILQE